MGTPMAPSLANLFMNEIETAMLNEYDDKLVSGLSSQWIRYINNVFFLWTYNEESLRVLFVRMTQNQAI